MIILKKVTPLEFHLVEMLWKYHPDLYPLPTMAVYTCAIECEGCEALYYDSSCCEEEFFETEEEAVEWLVRNVHNKEGLLKR